jgi:large subunit ribosomal protein L25
MEQIVIQAERRELRGDGPARRLRAQGLIPAVVYGQGFENAAVAVPARAVADALRLGGANVLVDLRVPDMAHTGAVAAMIRQIQRDPVRHQPLHVDFQWVSLSEKITATVPVVVEGEAAGVLVGGVVDLSLHEVEVECLPTAIPEHLVVDISGMEIRDSKRVADLQVPAGVTVLTAAEETVVSILPPMAEEALETQLEELPEETSDEEH